MANTSFKQYLHLSEEATTDDNWFFTSKQQINAWFETMGVGAGNYYINKDNTVSYNGNSLLITNHELIWYKGKKCVLPVNFRSCKSDFTVSATDMLSLKGVPRSIGGAFKLMTPNITSVEYLPEEADDIYLHTSGIVELKGIEKWVKNTYGLFVPIDVKGLLSLVKIKNLNLIKTWSNAPDDLKRACKIVTKYCEANTHDVFACQEELIDAGLKDYAEL